MQLWAAAESILTQYEEIIKHFMGNFRGESDNYSIICSAKGKAPPYTGLHKTVKPTYDYDHRSVFSPDVPARENPREALAQCKIVPSARHRTVYRSAPLKTVRQIVIHLTVLLFLRCFLINLQRNSTLTIAIFDTNCFCIEVRLTRVVFS